MSLPADPRTAAEGEARMKKVENLRRARAVTCCTSAPVT